MDKYRPKVNIIILNYKSYELTISEIKNIEDTIEYDGLEIVIVDNNSPNESYNIIDSFLQKNQLKFNYTLLKSNSNNGYASGNNIGLNASINRGAKYSLVINNDIIFSSPNTIMNLVNYLDGHDDVGIISPRIEGIDGYHDKPIYYKKPSFYDMTIGLRAFMKTRLKQNDEMVYEVYAPRGSCMMIRNDALEKIGLLDEGTFLYYEEPILAERMLKNGMKTVHYGKEYVIHNHAKTISSNITQKKNRVIVVQSMDYYLKKYRKFNVFERMICRFVRKYAYLISHK